MIVSEGQGVGCGEETIDPELDVDPTKHSDEHGMHDSFMFSVSGTTWGDSEVHAADSNPPIGLEKTSSY